MQYLRKIKNLPWTDDVILRNPPWKYPRRFINLSAIRTVGGSVFFFIFTLTRSAPPSGRPATTSGSWRTQQTNDRRLHVTSAQVKVDPTPNKERRWTLLCYVHGSVFYVCVHECVCGRFFFVCRIKNECNLLFICRGGDSRYTCGL